MRCGVLCCNPTPQSRIPGGRGRTHVRVAQYHPVRRPIVAGSRLAKGAGRVYASITLPPFRLARQHNSGQEKKAGRVALGRRTTWWRAFRYSGAWLLGGVCVCSLEACRQATNKRLAKAGAPLRPHHHHHHTTQRRPCLALGTSTGTGAAAGAGTLCGFAHSGASGPQVQGPRPICSPTCVCTCMHACMLLLQIPIRRRTCIS